MTEPFISHYRAPFKRDSRVALCSQKWCSWNTDKRDEVNCPECLAKLEKQPNLEACDCDRGGLSHMPWCPSVKQ